jgi:hypothetical protein
LADHQTDDLEAAAWLVAENALRVRFGVATHLFDIWRTAATTGVRLDQAGRSKIEPFIDTALGLPGDPKPDDHLQGYVAEFVWFLLTREVPGHGRNIRRIEQPGFYVTAQGGDGLVVYELANRTLIFRLWEIKKHIGSRHLSGTVARAFNQLGRKGATYLAQYVALAPELEPMLADLYGRLVDLWVDAAPSAGAGVAVGTSHSQAPRRRCFSAMQRYFPRLNHGDQLEGLIVAIGNFPAFASRVREFVWSAL